MPLLPNSLLLWDYQDKVVREWVRASIASSVGHDDIQRWWGGRHRQHRQMMQRKEAVYEYDQRRPHTGMISALLRFLYTFTMMLMTASLLVFVSDLLPSLVSHSRCSDILLKIAFCGKVNLL
jgi:hypothetical protein